MKLSLFCEKDMSHTTYVQALRTLWAVPQTQSLQPGQFPTLSTRQPFVTAFWSLRTKSNMILKHRVRQEQLVLLHFKAKCAIPVTSSQSVMVRVILTIAEKTIQDDIRSTWFLARMEHGAYDILLHSCEASDSFLDHCCSLAPATTMTAFVWWRDCSSKA